jgi:hypothetical protein
MSALPPKADIGGVIDMSDSLTAGALNSGGMAMPNVFVFDKFKLVWMLDSSHLCHSGL